MISKTAALLRALPVTVAILLLAACGTPGYDSWRTHVDAEAAGADNYVVTVSASGITSMSELRRAGEEYALIKAAQTTLAHGGSEFVIWDGKVEGLTYNNGNRVLSMNMSITVDDGPHDGARKGKRYKAQEVLDIYGAKHLE